MMQIIFVLKWKTTRNMKPQLFMNSVKTFQYQQTLGSDTMFPDRSQVYQLPGMRATIPSVLKGPKVLCKGNALRCIKFYKLQDFVEFCSRQLGKSIPILMLQHCSMFI